ncbi:MAG: hypothetical protein ACOYXS_07845 [Chloroflexota bacterium]
MIASKAIVDAFFISSPVSALGPVNGPSMPILRVSVVAGAEEPAAEAAGSVVVPAPPVDGAAVPLQAPTASAAAMATLLIRNRAPARIIMFSL